MTVFSTELDSGQRTFLRILKKYNKVQNSILIKPRRVPFLTIQNPQQVLKKHVLFSPDVTCFFNSRRIKKTDFFSDEANTSTLLIHIFATNIEQT